MVATRAPQREEYLARVLVARARAARRDRASTAEVTGRPKHLWSIYEKMVVRGKEFDDIHDLVGHPGHRRVREGLLGGARRHPRHLGPGAGPLQGLHQHAQVQPLPVAAHDGDRARRQAHRGADPHRRDAPPGRVRHRRPLGLQGPRRTTPRRWRGCSASSTWTARDRRPDRVPRGPEARPRAGRGLRLHAQGQGHRPAGALDAGRLRLRHPHRGRATAASAPRSTAAWSRSTPGCTSADTVEIITSKVAHGRAVAGLAPDRRLAPGPQQDPPVVLPGAARGRHRERPRGADQGAAPRGPARCRSCSAPTRPRAGGRVHEPTPTSTRCTPSSARARSRPGRWSSAWPEALRGGGRRRAAARRPRVPGPRRPRPGGGTGRGRLRRGARRRHGAPGPLLHAGARRPDRRLRHPGPGVSVHRADCANAVALADRVPGAADRGRVGPRATTGCSWPPSRCWPSTAPACWPT